LRSVHYEPGSCPHAEWISDRIVSLPTGPQVDQRQVDRAVEYLNT
jgi:dTDP-4-amino-4,6-dideoxygalactose transaminase